MFIFFQLRAKWYDRKCNGYRNQHVLVWLFCFRILNMLNAGCIWEHVFFLIKTGKTEKLTKETGNVGKRQPDKRAENSIRPPISFQNNEKKPHPEAGFSWLLKKVN